MTKSDWDKVVEISDKVLDLQRSDRKEVLRALCEGDAELMQNVEQHLQGIEESALFWDESISLNQELLVDEEDTFNISFFPDKDKLIGQQLGAYEVTELIGSGGMGNVYLADRADGRFTRKVAIKLVAMSIHFAEVKHRFIREQQILGRLSHPGIAQLFDAGITEAGHPYLVMEYIDGEDLTSYLNANELTTDLKLAIFSEICEVVEFAHKNLVVHRDLKPSNILIDKEGNIKILDFGISKLMEDSEEEKSPEMTGQDQKLYTLKYAAPEQIRHEMVSTVTDVYSLGLLLYEVLMGAHPFDLADKNRRESEEHVLTTEVPSLGFDFDRDLDAIIAKATQKEPDRRYASVREFKEDIIRYLNDEPITARPNSAFYKAVKFYKRSKSEVLTGTFFVSLIIFFTVFYVININEQKRLALKEEQKARIASEYLVDLFEGTGYNSEDPMSQTLGDFLEKSIAELSNLNNQPEMKEEAAFNLGKVAYNLSKYSSAITLFEESMRLNLINEEKPGSRRSEILAYIGNGHLSEGNFRASIPYLMRSREGYLSNGEADPGRMGNVYRSLAIAYAHTGNVDSAMILANSAIEMGLENEENDETINNYMVLADVIRENEAYQESALLLESILERYDRNEMSMSDYISIRNSIGYSYRMLDDYKKAIEHYERSLELSNEFYGRSHQRTLISINNIAYAYTYIGDFDQAIELRKEHLNRTRETHGDIHWRVASSYGVLADIVMQTGRLEESLAYHDESINVYNSTLGAEHFWTLRQQVRKAGTMGSMGDMDEAEELLLASISLIKTNLTGPLSYYERDSLDKISEQFIRNGQAEFAVSVAELASWHDNTFR